MKGRKFSATDLQERMRKNRALADANPGFIIEAGKPRPFAETGLERAGSPETTILPPKRSGGRKKRREMNRTEAEFDLMLKKWEADGWFVTHSYEGITLRWRHEGTELSYTPDFISVRDIIPAAIQSEAKNPYVQITLFEIKGAHAWKQDIVKFKAALIHFKIFEFQLWEKGENGWQKTI